MADTGYDEGMFKRSLTTMTMLGGMLAATGCVEKPGSWPGIDPALGRPVDVIKADARGRGYPQEAPRVRNMPSRAVVGYHLKQIDVANFSDADWNSVEVWVNQKYVAYLTTIRAGSLRTIRWDRMFDTEGNTPPRESHDFIINSIEVYFGGKLYDVTVRPGYGAG
jgi:hypothetical protein